MYQDQTWTTGLSVLALLISGVALFFVFSGQGGFSNTGDRFGQSTLDQVISAGRIDAAYVKYPPTVTVRGDSVSGFLVDVMDQIAEEADLEISFEETTFGNMGAALSSERADIIVGAVFKTIPRAARLGFTSPIMYWGGTAGVVDTSLTFRIDELSDINNPEITVTVTSGTAEHDWAKDNLSKANLRPIPNDDISLTLAEVSAGRADVALADAYAVETYANTHADVAPLLDGRQFNSFAVSFVVRKEDDELREFLNESIEVLHVNGTIEQLSRKWEGDQDIWDLPDRPRRK